MDVKAIPDSNDEVSTDVTHVSVVVPVRNEAAFIEKCIRDLMAQDYPAQSIEIIIADGMSTDGTREILDRLAAEHTILRVLDNPRRIVPTGLNLAIQAARGEVIIRVDGHCELERSFVSESVEVLREHPEAWSVGGPIIHAGRSPLGKAIALAMSHPLGVGNATHRFANFQGYAEGAQFPTVPRWVFDRIGYFDESLVRNQDDEFNYRIHKAGGRVFVSPRIRFRYYVREKLKQLLRQYFQYGFWRIPVMRKHQRPTTLRQIVPSTFFVAVIAFGVVGVALRKPALALFLPAVYSVTLTLSAANAALKHGLKVGLRLPVAIAVMHAGYAFGLLYGLWASKFHREAWTSAGRQAALSR